MEILSDEAKLYRSSEPARSRDEALALREQAEALLEDAYILMARAGGWKDSRPVAPDKINPATDGTRGREVLERIYSLGGMARAPEIAEGMVHIGEDRTKRIKRIRTYIFHLGRTGYLEQTGERGEWRISKLGYRALCESARPVRHLTEPEADDPARPTWRPAWRQEPIE